MTPFERVVQEMNSQSHEMPASIADFTSDQVIPEPDYVAIEEEEDEVMDETDEVYKTLPLSKVKRIFKLDPEYSGAAASAAYATAVAAELFVQYLAEQSAMIAKTERRKKIQYKDVSAAANSQEALYFLSDAIPKTQILGEAIKLKKINVLPEDQQKLTAQEEEVINVDALPETVQAIPAVVNELPKGQSTLPFEVVPVKKAGLLDLMTNDEPMVIE